MRLLLFSLVALTCMQTSAGAGEGWAVPMPAESGKRLRTCSRAQPVGITGYWELSAEEVAHIDRLLVTFVRRPEVRRRIRRRPEDFGRQLLGVRRESKRYVYINAFPADARGAPAPSSKELYISCDRGPEFWGVEYDLEKKRFVNFAVDGLLPPPRL